jgi:hypothetical protein
VRFKLEVSVVVGPSVDRDALLALAGEGVHIAMRVDGAAGRVGMERLIDAEDALAAGREALDEMSRQLDGAGLPSPATFELHVKPH